MSKEWYDRHWLPKSTPEFEDWWRKEYGEESDYATSDDERNEYWVRKGFAHMGWIGAKGESE